MCQSLAGNWKSFLAENTPSNHSAECANAPKFVILSHALSSKLRPLPVAAGTAHHGSTFNGSIETAIESVDPIGRIPLGREDHTAGDPNNGKGSFAGRIAEGVLASVLATAIVAVAHYSQDARYSVDLWLWLQMLVAL